jgi:hypothetical protein
MIEIEMSHTITNHIFNIAEKPGNLLSQYETNTYMPLQLSKELR